MVETLSLFAARRIYGVGELLGQLKKQTEAAFDFVWVRGEISGLRRPASGHYYFSLKDADGSLKAVMFRHQAGLLRFRLEEGAQVLCQGRLSVYVPRGDVQLVVDTAEPLGAGALALAFEQLKKRLAGEGLFDQGRKRPLPEMPWRVAVVTSPSGAAVRDFLKVVHRRHDRLAVAVYPVKVQGEGAAEQMTRALDDLARWGWPEVIVLTRGGGSTEDLWEYNNEGLARAIAACPIPVVSAVGHEIDVTISDMVADLRAPTPSAAAELLTAEAGAVTARLAEARARLERAARQILRHAEERLAALRRGLVDPRRALADKRRLVDELAMRLAGAQAGVIRSKRLALGSAGGRLALAGPRLALAEGRAAQRELSRRLVSAMINDLLARRSRADTLAHRLRALGPLNVLGRGFALATDEQGAVLRDSRRISPGQRLDLRLARGRLRAIVEEILE